MRLHCRMQDAMGKPGHRRFKACLAGLCIAAMAFSALASEPLAALKAQFALPDSQVNFGTAKLTIDRLIDPSTDTTAIERELDHWEQAIRSNVPPGANGRQILDALLKTLYKSGPWNDGRPFTYDLGDPLGKKPANKRLATYLATRNGNCVSMPILVAILGQRLGLTITLSTAPEHVLAKFADDSVQRWINVEATSGGYKSDEGYARETDISQTALDNEIYLRPLYPHEAVGVMASTLMEHYARKHDATSLMTVADLALKANPKDTVAMVWKANAYYLQIEDRYWNKYPKATDIPSDKVDDYKRLSRENLAWFNKAEALGWAQTTQQERTDYLQSIEHEKAKRGQ
jgi:regulator of sirC expression with transglutaminase-like and TPR domain